MNGIYQWKQVGSHCTLNNIPLPQYRAEIGKDSDGNTWLCDVQYREHERKFMVRFDTDVETDTDFPFLRDEVVEANIYDYWNSSKRVYHMKMVCYELIPVVIQEFVEQRHIVL